MNETSPPGWKRYLPALKLTAQIVIILLIIWSLYGIGQKVQADFAKHKFSPKDLDWPCVALACLFYVLAQIPASWFWHEALVAMGQAPGRWESFRAYFMGHLGKYVPGKAFVVIMRSAMISSPRVNTTVAAVSVFVETLTLMAVGAVIAAIIVVVQPPQLQAWRNIDPVRQQQLLVLVAVGLGFCAGIPTAPPLFRAVVRRLPYVKSHPAVEPAIRGLTLKVMARGWAAMAVNWIFMGLALFATLRAMGALVKAPVEFPASLGLLTATICLANVAGFLIPTPGGIGTREVVVTVLLAPVFGEPAALVSAVVMRLVTVLSEVAVSIILYPLKARTVKPEA